MDPSNDQQFLLVAIVEELLFVERLTCITRTSLLRYYQACDKHGIGLQDATKHSTRLEVEACVRRGHIEELLTQLGRQENWAKGVAILKVG
jgi:hypothetical protein